MTCSSIEVMDSIQAVTPVKRKKTFPFSVNGYFRLNLKEHTPSDVWDNVFNSKESQKKYIRRFEKSGYEFRDSKCHEDIDNFYRYYSLNLNHINATPFDRSHFNIIFNTFPNDHLRLTFLEKGDEIAGGLLALLYPDKKRMYLRYMAINRSIPSTFHPPYALYWDAINYGFMNGYEDICFGTNTNDPSDRSFRIKKGFGCRYCDTYGTLLPMNTLYESLYRASQLIKGHNKSTLK